MVMIMVHSIFEPKKAYVKDKDGVVKEVPYVTPGQDNFEKYYIDREIVEKVRLLEGGTDEDFVIDLVVKETKRDVFETINSQADDVGLDNALRKFAMTGDPSVLPQEVKATDDILDLTALPQDDAEYFEYIHGLAAKFYALPADLRKDLTMQEFIEGVMAGKIDVNAYVAGLQKAPEDDDAGGDK